MSLTSIHHGVLMVPEAALFLLEESICESAQPKRMRASPMPSFFGTRPRIEIQRILGGGEHSSYHVFGDPSRHEYCLVVLELEVVERHT